MGKYFGSFCFLRKGNKFLLVFDPRPIFDCWRVPGGKVKARENIEKALKREIKEELNLDIEVKKLLGYGQDVIKLKRGRKIGRMVLYFLCSVRNWDKLEIKAGDEISRIEFFTLEEIKRKRKIEPALRVFLKSLKTKLNF